jgi:FkbM family methyltransferase
LHFHLQKLVVFSPLLNPTLLISYFEAFFFGSLFWLRYDVNRIRRLVELLLVRLFQQTYNEFVENHFQQGISMLIRRKLATAQQVYNSGGIKGVAVAARDSIRSTYLGARHWYWSDHAYLAKLVAMLGDRIHLNGAVFDLSHPAITPDCKSLMLLNRYEQAERYVLRRYLDPDLPVIELGAAMGVVSVLTNRRLKDRTRHVVVEANPALIPVLERNRDLNGCGFAVVNKALSYESDTVTLYLGQSILESSAQVEHASAVTVPAVTLAELADEYGFGSFMLICDIECGEVDLVRREADTLGSRVEAILMEIHEQYLPAAAVADLLNRLGSLGFTQVYRDRKVYLFRKVKET